MKSTKFLIPFIFLSFLVLSSCYQAHSDDGLRTIPTTNNPNIVPKSNMGMPSI